MFRLVIINQFITLQRTRNSIEKIAKKAKKNISNMQKRKLCKLIDKVA